MHCGKYCLLGLIFLGVGSCTRETGPTAPDPQSPFHIHASIRELMDAEIDPAADVIWESVAVVNGEEQQPRTPEEWQAVRRAAITLLEATNLILMDGRPIAPPGVRYPEEADPQVLQARLDANRASFVGMTQALRSVGTQILEAVDAKDAQKLFELGGTLDEACEACHVVYWYPPDLEPKN